MGKSGHVPRLAESMEPGSASDMKRRGSPAVTQSQADEAKSLPIDLPGTFKLILPTGLSDGPRLHDRDLQLLQPGTLVEVLEIMVVADDKRVRAKIKSPSGWISLRS